MNIYIAVYLQLQLEHNALTQRYYIQGYTTWNKPVKPYKRLQSQGHVKNQTPTVVASLILVACLVAESIQHLFYVFADPL